MRVSGTGCVAVLYGNEGEYVFPQGNYDCSLFSQMAQPDAIDSVKVGYEYESPTSCKVVLYDGCFDGDERLYTDGFHELHMRGFGNVSSIKVLGSGCVALLYSG